MFIAILTLLSALSISGVAIFYSVIGLATIFPGAFWPVVIMGSVLEVGKLVTASWLYRNWRQTRFLLKTYLTIAVVVLSLITSMGIFGFLSKAHLEQNLAENTMTQRIEIINSKIQSEETYIKRQLKIIERAENTLNKTTTSNKDAIDLEQQSLKDVQDKFKTLLTVETNTVKDLNDRIKTLDADVTAILTQQNKAFFNEEKAAADLKASQKEERSQINDKIAEAQDRIKILKDDYAVETAVIQKRIDGLREGNIDDKSDVNAQIEVAEANILKAQDNIDDLIIDREPLEAKMIKLEAEVGPVKYIASLVVDWGITTEVDTSEAVRWVILIIIFVFDPLAVLLLVAANQSLIRKFPVEPIKPQEIVDLEKPDEEDVTLKWNEMYNKQDAVERMEKATAQLQEWKDKLEAFNAKVPKPSAEAPVEIIQEDNSIPHIDLKGSKKIADNMKDGFDPSEVEGYEEFNKNYEVKTSDPADVIKEIKKEQEEEKQQKELEAYKERIAKEEEFERLIQKEAEFKEREEKERKALEEYSRKAREDEQEKLYEQSIAEQIEEAMKSERIKPDFTEVIEPELTIEKPKNEVKNAKPLVVRTIKPKPKEEEPPKPVLSNWQRAELLDNFHKEHGNFKDVQEYVQNEEQGDTTLWQKSKKATSEIEYHEQVGKRIDDLMAKIEKNEIKLEDLSEDDQRVINEINQQKNDG